MSAPVPSAPSNVIVAPAAAPPTDAEVERRLTKIIVSLRERMPGKQITASQVVKAVKSRQVELKLGSVDMDAKIPLIEKILQATSAAVPLNDDDDDEFVYLGVFHSSIVGIQHYTGIVNKDESLVLERQPSNPYDKNAIRVLNTSLQQVGHIPRDTAAVLAPIMDANHLILEAKTGKNVTAKYKIGISVTAFVLPKEAARIERLMKESSYGSDAREIDTSPPTEMGGGGKLSPQQFEEKMAGIFSSVALPEKDLSEKDPTDKFRGTLMPFQRYGLAWMLRREEERAMPIIDHTSSSSSASAATVVAGLARQVTRKRSRSGAQSQSQQATQNDEEEKSSSAPQPFWVKLKEKDGTVKYVHVLTNHATTTAPMCTRGGILADEMGLGKTIQVLALLSHPTVTTVKAGAASHCGKSLIVCPMSLMGHWQSHIETYLPGTAVMCFYGADRKASQLTELAVGAIVLTTYGVLRSSEATLKNIVWERVILDEAHCIKSSKTATAKSAATLQACCRWCLTGTPLQNHLDDLQSLISFLRLDPFDNIQWWRGLISRPLRARHAESIDRLRSVVASVCLRRTKEMMYAGKPLVVLPALTINLVELELSLEERCFYMRIKEACGEQFKAWEKEKRTEKMMAHALVMLLRLRQLCGDRRLVPNIERDFGGASLVVEPSSVADKMSDEEAQLLVAADETCAICLETITSAVITRCRHVFCKTCVELLVRGNADEGTQQTSRCPLCREELVVVKESKALSACTPQEGVGAPSTKVAAVVQLVLDAVRGKEKIVVFSQWPSMLDLIAQALRTTLGPLGLQHASLDGRMTLAQRSTALAAFRDDPNFVTPVMLLSTMAGGTGLNLTVATRCVLVDPWWNPSIDRQAMMRIHRVGQTRAVTVTRLVMKDTVETMILGLQAKKQAVSEGALGGPSGLGGAGSGLTLDDLRTFF